MLSEIDYKEIVKKAKDLDPKDRKLIDITKKLIGNYFVREPSWHLYKVYSISVNPRGVVSVLFTVINAYKGKKENSWCSVKYFLENFDLVSQGLYEQTIDELILHLKK